MVPNRATHHMFCVKVSKKSSFKRLVNPEITERMRKDNNLVSDLWQIKCNKTFL